MIGKMIAVCSHRWSQIATRNILYGRPDGSTADLYICFRLYLLKIGCIWCGSVSPHEPICRPICSDTMPTLKNQTGLPGLAKGSVPRWQRKGQKMNSFFKCHVPDT